MKIDKSTNRPSDLNELHYDTAEYVGQCKNDNKYKSFVILKEVSSDVHGRIFSIGELTK